MEWASSLSHIFFKWIIVLKIEKLKKSTSLKDYLYKISGVDQGNSQQLNKTTTDVLVFIELSHCVLLN